MTVTETTTPPKRGICECCETHAPLPVEYVEDRKHGRVVHVSFCCRKCLREWLLRIDRLPDIGISTSL